MPIPLHSVTSIVKFVPDLLVFVSVILCILHFYFEATFDLFLSLAVLIVPSGMQAYC
jgi:hypothetical protein